MTRMVIMTYKDWTGRVEVLDCGHNREVEPWERVRLGGRRDCRVCRRNQAEVAGAQVVDDAHK